MARAVVLLPEAAGPSMAIITERVGKDRIKVLRRTDVSAHNRDVIRVTDRPDRGID